jgi:flavin reductase
MSTSLPATSAGEFKTGMRRLAAGVTIITTVHDGRRHGLTATAVTSLTAEPPQLLVCVNRQAGAHDLIHAGERFCVNVLSQRHRPLAARFANHAVNETDRFRVGKWTTLATGAPVLEDALASFDCVVLERVSTSSHTIYIGCVVGVRARDTGRPLLYESGGYAGLRALKLRPRRRVRHARAA